MVAELAEKIKTLREANTVEAAPERTGTRKVTRAEVPVTARIRRREMAEVGQVEVEQVVQVEPKSAGDAGQPAEAPGDRLCRSQ